MVIEVEQKSAPRTAKVYECTAELKKSGVAGQLYNLIVKEFYADERERLPADSFRFYVKGTNSKGSVSNLEIVVQYPNPYSEQDRYGYRQTITHTFSVRINNDGTGRIGKDIQLSKKGVQQLKEIVKDGPNRGKMIAFSELHLPESSSE